MISQRTNFCLNFLSYRNPIVRKKAAQSLEQLGDRSCVSRLRAHLEKEDCDVVIAAVQKAITKLESWP